MSADHPYSGFVPFDRDAARSREGRANTERRRRFVREQSDAFVLLEARRGRPEYVAEAERRGISE